MEDSKRDEGLEKKMKYVKPELISLDKDERAEGGSTNCTNGSNPLGNCTTGASVR
jgi:hypothetical protein